MSKAISFYSDLYAKLVDELNYVRSNESNVLRIAELSIKAVRRNIAILKDHVLGEEFASAADEIHFFKVIKPNFFCQLVYYSRIFSLEVQRPTAGRRAEIKYLQKEENKINWFSDKYLDFYKYYRSNAEFLDDKMFLRGEGMMFPALETFGLDTDPRFTTSHDYLVSRMAANDLLKTYLERELQKLEVGAVTIKETHDTDNLLWTASKASLIELLYSLHSTGVFNNGTAGLNQIANFLEEKFKVKLGNYYRTFQEIRIRKKNRTQFIDELKDRLIKKMDYDDENPRS